MRTWALLPAALMAAACSTAPRVHSVGLFSSLPIQWREAGQIRDLLSSDAPPHWALAVLRGQGEVRPIDSLLPGKRGSPLAEVTMLVMAQPRPLAPQENVALDRWVRGGGRLLLFADPMLTQHSVFALGDRRRPEPIAMLSPILARWGLRLEFDEEQPAGERKAALFGASVPVDLPGSFALAASAGPCALEPGKIAVQCRIGEGRVLALADAALLDAPAGGDREERVAALSRLLEVLKQAP